MLNGKANIRTEYHQFFLTLFAIFVSQGKLSLKQKQTYPVQWFRGHTEFVALFPFPPQTDVLLCGKELI